MAHVPTSDLVVRPVVAVNVVTLEQAEAFVEASEATGIPLILQISENTVFFHGSLAPLASAVLSMASAARTPLGVHLDHATSEDLVREAVSLGVRSVMFDASAAHDEENIARTSALVKELSPQGVWVEGEIGEIGGKGGAHTPGVLTPVHDAVRFAQETGVDALAVAVGSVHHMKEKGASLDFSRIGELARALAIPLVLHGSSGILASDLRRGISCGITKVNVATQFNAVFVAAVRQILAGEPDLIDPRGFLSGAKHALTTAMENYLVLVSSVKTE